MPVTERSPLLDSANGGYNNNGEPRSFRQKVVSFLKSEGQPTFARSYQYLFLSSWINLLLVFVPLSGVAHFANWDAGLRFSFSFLAIVPLAKLIGESTDQLSVELGGTLSALLNATFGNAVEIIVGIAALLRDEIRIVQTSMLGSILGNVLLVLGSAFIAGAFVEGESIFQVTAAQTSASLMTLGCITLVIPAAYRSVGISNDKGPFSGASLQNLLRDDGVPEKTADGLLIISRGTAILLLLVYAAYLVFQLKTHSRLFDDPEGSEEEESKMSPFAAATALLLVTVVTSFTADWLIASIEETAKRYHISTTFIGLILLPIVANAAEHTAAIFMALRKRHEAVIGICVGSSIQISLFVVPLLVLVGWISGHELTLFFSNFETIILFVSIVLVSLLIMDGRSNYMEGLMLVTLYIVIALTFWVSD